MLNESQSTAFVLSLCLCASVVSPWSVRWQLLFVGLLGTSVLWTYWPTLVAVADRWAAEPEYSHGWFVPLFAGFLLWYRRQRRPAVFAGNAWGLLLIAASLAAFLMGSYTQFRWLEAFSLLPCLFGVCLLAGGWAGVRWAWPAICFLVFMLPLPFRVEVSLARPLQSLATKASTVALVLLGFPATADGNIISINETKIGVAEACNGLSMLLTFFALAVACALVIRRPALDRVVIVLSAVPVALLSNVVRITTTGVL
jgi:exosortase